MIRVDDRGVDIWKERERKTWLDVCMMNGQMQVGR